MCLWMNVQSFGTQKVSLVFNYLTNPTFQYADEFSEMEAPRLPSYNHEVGYIWANYVTS